MKSCSYIVSGLDPGIAYVRESLYMPKSKVKLSAIQAALSFKIGDSVIEHYCVTDTHVVLPRYFLDHNRVRKNTPIVDLRPRQYPKVSIESKIQLYDNGVQRGAADAIRGNSGILVVPCGAGKTVLALNEIVQRNCPTLIVVNTEQLFHQWLERIKQFLSVTTTGTIRGSEWDWQHPITLAMLQTLAKRRNDVSEHLRNYFGLVVWDEVDEVATPVYSYTSDLFYGDRLGVTATPTRKDGMERIFRYHMGPILYKNEEFTTKPRVFFVPTANVVPSTEYVDYYSSQTNYGKLYTILSKDNIRTNVVKKLLDDKIKEGRKILVLGERKDQLRRLHEQYPGSGLCIHEVEVEERTSMLKSSNIIFAIRKLSKRGLDQADLDTLVCLFPMSDPAGVRQASGRILRPHDFKQPPEIYIIEDVNIPPIVDMCNKLRKTFGGWGFEQSNMVFVPDNK